MKKNISIEEEIKFEKILELSECQKAIDTFHDENEGFGICGYCKKGNVSFYDTTYLSKYIITETCKAKCPYFINR